VRPSRPATCRQEQSRLSWRTAGNDVFSGIIVMPRATAATTTSANAGLPACPAMSTPMPTTTACATAAISPLSVQPSPPDRQHRPGHPVNLTTTTAADGSTSSLTLGRALHANGDQPAGYLQGQNNLGSLGGSEVMTYSRHHRDARGYRQQLQLRQLPACQLVRLRLLRCQRQRGARQGDQPLPVTTITLAGSNDLGTAVNSQPHGRRRQLPVHEFAPWHIHDTEAQPPGYFQGKDTLARPVASRASRTSSRPIPLTTEAAGTITILEKFYRPASLVSSMLTRTTMESWTRARPTLPTSSSP